LSGVRGRELLGRGIAIAQRAPIYAGTRSVGSEYASGKTVPSAQASPMLPELIFIGQLPIDHHVRSAKRKRRFLRFTEASIFPVFYRLNYRRASWLVRKDLTKLQVMQDIPMQNKVGRVVVADNLQFDIAITSKYGTLTQIRHRKRWKIPDCSWKGLISFEPRSLISCEITSQILPLSVAYSGIYRGSKECKKREHSNKSLHGKLFGVLYSAGCLLCLIGFYKVFDLSRKRGEWVVFGVGCARIIGGFGSVLLLSVAVIG